MSKATATLPRTGDVFKRFEGNVYGVVLGAEPATEDSPARVTITTLYTKPFGGNPTVTRQMLDAFLLDFKPMDTEFLAF